MAFNVIRLFRVEKILLTGVENKKNASVIITGETHQSNKGGSEEQIMKDGRRDDLHGLSHNDKSHDEGAAPVHPLRLLSCARPLRPTLLACSHSNRATRMHARTIHKTHTIDRSCLLFCLIPFLGFSFFFPHGK